MKIEAPLRELFDCSSYNLAQLTPSEDDPIWAANPLRQQGSKVQRDTRSIVFRWLDNNWLPGEPLVIQEFDYQDGMLRDAVLECGSAIAASYGGIVVKLMLAELRAGGSIPPHRDAAEALRLSHRCHVPLLTHAGVTFIVDGERQFMTPGVAYELDNTREHAVANAGTVRRVHLICDVMEENASGVGPSYAGDGASEPEVSWGGAQRRCGSST